MPEISVVIPVRRGGSPAMTLKSLGRQSFADFDVIVSRDPEAKGACWARNCGARLATAPFILFSDDDIEWAPEALTVLHRTLLASPAAAYAYGAYRCGDRVNSNRQFDAAALRRQNFVSTMALVRRADHPGWDENLKRLQDWDVYLTMLEQGKTGVYCGQQVFSTPVRNGITYGGGISWEEAERIVKEKHGL